MNSLLHVLFPDIRFVSNEFCSFLYVHIVLRSVGLRGIQIYKILATTIFSIGEWAVMT